MDSLISFVKNNFQLIILLLSMLGVLVAILSLYVEIKKRKRKNEHKSEEVKEGE